MDLIVETSLAFTFQILSQDRHSRLIIYGGNLNSILFSVSHKNSNL